MHLTAYAENGFQQSAQGLRGSHHNDFHHFASLSLQNRLSQSLPRQPTQAPAPNAARWSGWSSSSVPDTHKAAAANRFLSRSVIKSRLPSWF